MRRPGPKRACFAPDGSGHDTINAWGDGMETEEMPVGSLWWIEVPNALFAVECPDNG